MNNKNSLTDKHFRESSCNNIKAYKDYRKNIEKFCSLDMVTIFELELSTLKASIICSSSHFACMDKVVCQRISTKIKTSAWRKKFMHSHTSDLQILSFVYILDSRFWVRIPNQSAAERIIEIERGKTNPTNLS